MMTRPAWPEHKKLCGKAGSGEDQTLNALYKRVGQQVVDMMGQIVDEVRLAGVCAHGLVGGAEDRLEEDCLIVHLEAGNRAERRRSQAFRFVSAITLPLDAVREAKPTWANTVAHFKESFKADPLPSRSLVLVMATFQHLEVGDASPHTYAVYRSLIQELDQPTVQAATAMRFATRQRWQERLAEAVRSARVG